MTTHHGDTVTSPRPRPLTTGASDTPIYDTIVGETLIDPPRWYAECDQLLAELREAHRTRPR